MGTDRNASTGSGWAGTTRERPLSFLTVMVGAAAAKFRSRHCRRANSHDRLAGMVTKICRIRPGVQ